jgi:C1A family cysteine protease
VKPKAHSNGHLKGAGLGALGWRRDLPDFRDYTPETELVKAVITKSQALMATKKAQPTSIDLRQWCSPIEDQEALGSCTANAGAGLVEYFERRAFGHHLDASRLFLYKVTRNLLGWVGDQGAYLRDTMKALVLAGVPPEHYWPYDITAFDDEPSAFCYAFAQNYKAIVYYRLDPTGESTEQVLKNVKQSLAAGLPSMFGFTVYSSFPGIGQGGDIPFPQAGDTVLGGHAVDAVGYDDRKQIQGERGALLIRNSWGTDWGEDGYGWMPYAYIEQGIAVDFWSLVQASFVDTELFKTPEVAAGVHEGAPARYVPKRSPVHARA